MSRVSGSIVIDRPPEVVFDFVGDETNEPLYNPALLSSKMITDGPVGVGTRFHATHKQGRNQTEMVIDITAYDRPRRMASRTTMSWSDIEGDVTFERVGGRTRMRWSWDVHPKGRYKLLTPIIGVVGRRMEQACWQGLKRYLEGIETPNSLGIG